MIHKSYQSCEELDYSGYNVHQKPCKAKQHSPRIPQIAKQHSPNFQSQQAFPFSPSPGYQSSSTGGGKTNIGQRKLPQQPGRPTADQLAFDYSQVGMMAGLHEPNFGQSKHSPQSIKSPDVDSLGSTNLVLQTFRRDDTHIRPPKQQQSIYGTSSRRGFATERSHSMLDASHFQLKKHPNFLRQQQSIANELREKQKLKQQRTTEFLLPMYQAKEKAKSRELLSDEPSEEDTPSSGLSG